MTPDRNPEELAQYLDELFRTQDTPSVDTIDDPQVEVALQLAQTNPPQLSDEARARMRSKVQQAHQKKVNPPKRPIQFPGQRVLRWVAGFVLVFFLMNNVAVPVMADSLPGDLLYPVKRALESMELSLATSDMNRADVYFTQASRRLNESQRLLTAEVIDEDLVLQAIENLTQANQLNVGGGDIQTRLDSLSTQITDHIEDVSLQDVTTAEMLNEQLSSNLPPPEEQSVSEQSAPIVEDVPTATDTSTPSPTTTPTYTATATLTPTATSTPTHTATSSPTATLTATSTLTPSATPTDEPTLTPTYESYIGVVSATANVNIRTLPTTDGEIVAMVAPGTIVTVIGESLDGQWLKVAINGDQMGWIASSLIEEGTVPLFVAPPETSIEETEPLPSVQDTEPIQSDTTTDTSATNQGNDGINKFDCDGQGNFCNAGNQGNNGNNNGNNGNGKGNNKN